MSLSSISTSVERTQKKGPTVFTFEMEKRAEGSGEPTSCCRIEESFNPSRDCSSLSSYNIEKDLIFRSRTLVKRLVLYYSKKHSAYYFQNPAYFAPVYILWNGKPISDLFFVTHNFLKLHDSIFAIYSRIEQAFCNLTPSEKNQFPLLQIQIGLKGALLHSPCRAWFSIEHVFKKNQPLTYSHPRVDYILE